MGCVWVADATNFTPAAVVAHVALVARPRVRRGNGRRVIEHRRLMVSVSTLIKNGLMLGLHAVARRYRMAYIYVLVTRPLVTVVIAATLGLASPGGVLFRCRFDGLVRTACCCEQERSTQEHPGLARATAGGCCDVLVRAPVTREALKADPPAGLADIQVVVPPTPTPWPVSFVAASALQVSWTGPPPLSGPLFLQSCSFLI
jgi:hypothetical protein